MTQERDARVDQVIDALLTKRSVRVKTATRTFEGPVFEVGRSPYDDLIRARVVDDQGLVHYFRVDKIDAEVESL